MNFLSPRPNLPIILLAVCGRRGMTDTSPNRPAAGDAGETQEAGT